VSADVKEYQCPSCGADLHFAEDQFMITCSYCGARVERELDRNEHDKVSARKQLKTVKKYYDDTLTLHNLQKKRDRAKQRLKLCSENSLSELTLLEKHPYIVFAAAFVLSVAVFLFDTRSVGLRVVSLLILLASLPVFVVQFKKGRDKKQLIDQSAKRLDMTQKEFVKAGDELEKFEKSFDISVIPDGYREIKTLEYMIHVFETYQAATMGECLKLCDEYLAQQRLEDMKRQQLARVMMISQSMKRDRESNAVSSDGIPFMKRGSFAEIVMAKKKADSGRDAGADLMMALAKASADGKNKE